MLLITPLLRDQQLLDSIAALRATGQFAIWWLGQSGFLITYQGSTLLIDPYLSNSLTTKYAATPKPHIRMTEIPIDPARLGFVDLVTSSHNHTDHLDVETLMPLMQANPQITVVVSAANVAFAAERLAVPPDRLVAITQQQPLVYGPFRLHAVPAAHEQREADAHGHARFIGLVVQVGPYTLYHSGDTLRYDGMAELLQPFRIDVALLPINGRDPARGVAGNLSGPEAAQLAHDIAAGLVIPCHYEMFTFNTADPAAFAATAAALGQPYRILRCGECLIWD
jgi:L-ascorbate metabolism protein UlaG (beta-lactamase superfamily)